MTAYNVSVTVRYTVPIDTDQAAAYPHALIEGKTGAQLAEAMAQFDAEEGDEPMDVYSTDSKFVSATAIRSEADFVPPTAYDNRLEQT